MIYFPTSRCKQNDKVRVLNLIYFSCKADCTITLLMCYYIIHSINRILCHFEYSGQICNPLHFRINQQKQDILKYNSINVEYLYFKHHDLLNITIKILIMLLKYHFIY